MGKRPTKAEPQADVQALVKGADQQTEVIADLHKQLRTAQATADQRRLDLRTFADTVGRYLGARACTSGPNESHRDDADTLRIAFEIHKLAKGGVGDNAAEVLRLLIEEHDAPWNAPVWLAELLDLDDGDEVTRANVDAAIRRFREPLEEVLGKGDTLAGLADRAVKLILECRNADGTQAEREAQAKLEEIDALCRDMRVRRKMLDHSPSSRLAFIGYLFGLVDGR